LVQSLTIDLQENGKIMPCVDYRALNSKTLKDAYPIKSVQKNLDAMAGAALFSTFDLTSGYHQIPVSPLDIPKITFSTKYGLYEFRTMPFGVCNGAATCQRLMELVFQRIQWQICLIYLDDVIVYSKNFEEHVQRLDLVLERIVEAGLKLKPEKCEMFRSKVVFLGYVDSEKGIEPNPDNVANILSLSPPKTVKEVRQVVGMGSYYRRCIQNYSSVVRPLIELTKKNKSFDCTLECQTAFNTLKSAFTSTGIMGFPRDKGEFYLDTDASDYQIGAVLSQMQDGQLKVISYESRLLNKAEKNYCVTDKELLAVRYFIEYYRQYLLGRKFCVRTDHLALIWLFSMKEPEGRVARWLEILSPFDFYVEYRPGPKHTNADCMSRCNNPRDCECNETDNLEYLKCDPCKKCQKRAIDMESSLKSMSSYLTKENPQELSQNHICSVKTREQSDQGTSWTLW
jgi:hypothetical protein